MDLEALKTRARERAGRLSAGHVVDETYVGDVLAFFQRVPEPPVYRRRDDPTRAQARELLEVAEGLLARGWAAGAAHQGFTRALEAHLAVLACLADGRVEAAEPAWLEARASERAATAPLKLWTRPEATRPKVYDAATGRSRFDPQPDAAVEARLSCPWCRKVGSYRLSSRVAMHGLSCAHCARGFGAYVAELRSLAVEGTGRSRRRYHFRVLELGGPATTVDFEDASRATLAASPRDLLAFLYAPAGELRAVLNLDTSRVLWVSAPTCFVATVAFGPDAPELDVLRGFRDRVLARSAPGRAFVRWYYRSGPALAGWVAPRPRARRLVRRALEGVVRLLEPGA